MLASQSTEASSDSTQSLPVLPSKASENLTMLPTVSELGPLPEQFTEVSEEFKKNAVMKEIQPKPQKPGITLATSGIARNTTSSRRAGILDDEPLMNSGRMRSPSDKSEALFDARSIATLQKLGITPKCIESLTTLKKHSQSDAEKLTESVANFLCHDIKEAFQIILEKLSQKNKITIIIAEAHNADNFSLDIIKNIATRCTRVPIFLFLKPKSTYDTPITATYIESILSIKRFESYILSGFNSAETRELIRISWGNPSILSVCDRIADLIFKRAGGNPLFITTLATSLKESGQWRISNEGVLNYQGISNANVEQLLLGYDNQGVILARFDRLDRNLQLFLKVAACLGMNWPLDYVLYFITGIEDMSKKVGKDSYDAIIRGVNTADRFNFLSPSESLVDSGACFLFKSTVIRNCIYNLMAKQQRQQVHLYIAQFLETRVNNDSKKRRLLLQIFEHYNETNEKRMDKRLFYTELVAKYYYDGGQPSEAIKNYKNLMQLIQDHPTVEPKSNMVIASFYREYGACLYSQGNLSEAYDSLVQSLGLMGFTLPNSKWALFWKIRAQQKTKKLQARELSESPIFQNQPIADQGLKSIPLRNNTMALFKDASRSVQPPCMNESASFKFLNESIISVDNAIQQELYILGSICLTKRDFNSYLYMIFQGLSLQKFCTTTSLTGRLYSEAAVALTLKNTGFAYSPIFIEASSLLDQTKDIETTSVILLNRGIYYFLHGNMKKSMSMLDKSTKCSRTSTCLETRFRSQEFECCLKILITGRISCLNHANELVNRTLKYQRNSEQFWGFFHAIHCVILEEKLSPAMKPIKDTFQDLYKSFREAPILFQQSPVNRCANVSMMICEEVFVNASPLKDSNSESNILDYLKSLTPILSLITFYDWQLAFAVLPLVLCFVKIYFASKYSAAIKFSMEAACLSITKAFRRLKGMKIAPKLRYIFKGIEKLVHGDIPLANKAWGNGLNVTIDEKNETLYLDGILNTLIGKLSHPNRPQELQIGRKVLSDLNFTNFETIFEPSVVTPISKK